MFPFLQKIKSKSVSVPTAQELQQAKEIQARQDKAAREKHLANQTVQKYTPKTLSKEQLDKLAMDFIQKEILSSDAGLTKNPALNAQQGQWYRLMAEGYALRYDGGKCYILFFSNGRSNYLAKAVEWGIMGITIAHLSFDRFKDMLSMTPNEADLRIAYKIHPVSSPENYDPKAEAVFNNVSDGIPIWSSRPKQ
jgi:hypothetical protein